MRKIRKAVLVAIALYMTTAPAEGKRLPVPAPNPERGTIAVTLRGRAPAGNKAAAVQVYFVRLGEDADMFAAGSVLPSNFSEDKQVYLLNARPGRYVAVAAQFGRQGRDYNMFPDKATISQTEVEVRPGEIAFMGDILIDLKMKLTMCDEAQAHYLRLVEPGSARKGLLARMYSTSYTYCGELVAVDREPTTQKEFWSRALERVFDEEPAWTTEVEDELAELGGDASVTGPVIAAAPVAPKDAVPKESSLYSDYPGQFTLRLSEGWTAWDQSRLAGGELGPFNLIVFSPVDLAEMMKPTKDDDAIQRMTETMADLDTGRIECFTLNRHAASKGMSCEGFSEKATKKVLAMVKDSSFLRRGAEIAEEPRAERISVGGCQGLRVAGSGRGASGSLWTVDARAVSDGEVLYLFFVRALTEHFEQNQGILEMALSSLRMSAAS